MQMKSINVAAVVFACMLAPCTAFAADAVSPAAMPEADAEMKSASPPMAQATEPAAGMTVRNTRPKVDRHKDARACLESGDNKAVIKCANKYR